MELEAQQQGKGGMEEPRNKFEKSRDTGVKWLLLMHQLMTRICGELECHRGIRGTFYWAALPIEDYFDEIKII